MNDLTEEEATYLTYCSKVSSIDFNNNCLLGFSPNKKEVLIGLSKKGYITDDSSNTMLIFTVEGIKLLNLFRSLDEL